MCSYRYLIVEKCILTLRCLTVVCVKTYRLLILNSIQGIGVKRIPRKTRRSNNHRTSNKFSSSPILTRHEALTPCSLQHGETWFRENCQLLLLICMATFCSSHRIPTILSQRTRGKLAFRILWIIYSYYFYRRLSTLCTYILYFMIRFIFTQFWNVVHRQD